MTNSNTKKLRQKFVKQSRVYTDIIKQNFVAKLKMTKKRFACLNLYRIKKKRKFKIIIKRFLSELNRKFVLILCLI